MPAQHALSDDGSAVAVDSLTVGYLAGQTVLSDVSFGVSLGSSLLIMGHNGAGKTTLLEALFGLVVPQSGGVRLLGSSDYRSPTECVKAGISYCCSGVNVFATLSVRENLLVAGEATGASAADLVRRLDSVLSVFGELKELFKRQAGNLSGGQRQMLAVGMHVMQEPKLLLLDEPSLGLSPKAVGRLYGGIARMRTDLDMTMIVVEQSVDPDLLAPDQVLVLNSGRVARFAAGNDFARTDLLGLL